MTFLLVDLRLCYFLVQIIFLFDVQKNVFFRYIFSLAITFAYRNSGNTASLTSNCRDIEDNLTLESKAKQLKQLEQRECELQKFKNPWQALIAEIVVVMFVILLVAIKSYKIVNDETRLRLTGELNLTSIAQVQAVLDTPQITVNTLQFEDSPGAGAAATIILDKLEVLIHRHQLRTEALGYCASACAAAFLLGNGRSLLPSGDGKPTYLMLHAVRNQRTREVNYGKTEAINKKISQKSGAKFPLKLLNRIFDDARGNGDGEIFIFREAQRTPQGKHHVFVCDGQPHVLISECEAIPNVTPQSLGIQVSK